jgi:hypothetical protein
LKTGVSYRDEPSNPAIPGCLPISTLAKHGAMHTRVMRIARDTDYVEMVTTHHGGCIRAQYQELVEVFSKETAETLPPHIPPGHTIDLHPNYKLPPGQINNLSEFQLMTLKDYVMKNQANCVITQASSSAAVPILFSKTSDGGLRLGVDYRAFNLGTVKNRYSLPAI